MSLPMMAEPVENETATAATLSLPATWVGLHASHEAWIYATPDDRGRIDDSDLSILRSLAEIPAARWSSLCSAAGWTPLGAAAMSWCEGATLREVREAWETVEPLLTVDEITCRPARLLNPALLPETTTHGMRKLSSMVVAGDDNNLQISLQIAHHPAKLMVDLSKDILSGADPSLAEHIRYATELNAQA
ncbi:hypothetical protein [Tateyamaria sp. syn59]|uniref:hypothetical protein n=1 Tax=Tateyamaria sp. syn59 TaxID=2576942 RepID=UPI0011BDBD73|nr:hypothetical protein [Tateyamaria sp. syn59]